MYLFTADEHYGHHNIITYCNRPFRSIAEMNSVLIDNHNKVVGKGDVVVHVGDFTLQNKEYAASIIKQLNGQHIFIKGSHDKWLQNGPYLWEKRVGDYYVVACHYAMRVWPRSHYGSWLVYGHSHGHLPPYKKSIDVGVDANDFYPVSFDQLKELLKNTEEENANSTI